MAGSYTPMLLARVLYYLLDAHLLWIRSAKARQLWFLAPPPSLYLRYTIYNFGSSPHSLYLRFTIVKFGSPPTSLYLRYTIDNFGSPQHSLYIFWDIFIYKQIFTNNLIIFCLIPGNLSAVKLLCAKVNMHIFFSYLPTDLSVYTYIYTNTHICIHISIHLSTRIYIYICTYFFFNLYMYICEKLSIMNHI